MQSENYLLCRDRNQLTPLHAISKIISYAIDLSFMSHCCPSANGLWTPQVCFEEASSICAVILLYYRCFRWQLRDLTTAKVDCSTNPAPLILFRGFFSTLGTDNRGIATQQLMNNIWWNIFRLRTRMQSLWVLVVIWKSKWVQAWSVFNSAGIHYRTS